MIFPIRCFTCGKVIADKWEEYVKLTKKNDKHGDEPEMNESLKGFHSHNGKVLDDLKIDKICCRRMFLTHVDLVETI